MVTIYHQKIYQVNYPIRVIEKSSKKDVFRKILSSLVESMLDNEID